MLTTLLENKVRGGNGQQRRPNRFLFENGLFSLSDAHTRLVDTINYKLKSCMGETRPYGSVGGGG